MVDRSIGENGDAVDDAADDEDLIQKAQSELEMEKKALLENQSMMAEVRIYNLNDRTFKKY